MKDQSAGLVYVPYMMTSAICSPVMVAGVMRWDFGLFIGFSVELLKFFSEVICTHLSGAITGRRCTLIVESHVISNASICQDKITFPILLCHSYAFNVKVF
ncbi:hypothetical protein D3C76_1190460 [compost metagenome]